MEEDRGKGIHLKLERKRSRTLGIALTGMFAGAYTVFTLLLGSLSYGPLNLRFSNILLGMVPLVGWPAVFGVTLGVFLGNTVSSLGPLDLVTTIFSFAGLVCLQLLRKRSVILGLILYSAFVSLWVNFELNLVFHTSYFPQFYATFAGVAFVVVLLGYLVYRSATSSGIRRRIKDVIQD